MNIKKLREARGWTRQQMAEHFDVNVTTVLRWENNGVPARGPARRAIEIEFSERSSAASPHEAA